MTALLEYLDFSKGGGALALMFCSAGKQFAL